MPALPVLTLASYWFTVGCASVSLDDDDGGHGQGGWDLGTDTGATSGDAGTGDAGTGDGGASDGGATDGGATDGGGPDGGTDGGGTDGGGTDGGGSDGGATDGGATDGGGTDGGGTDGGGTDGGTPDYGESSCSPLAPVDLVGLVRTYDYLESSGIEGSYEFHNVGMDSYDDEEVWRAEATQILLDSWGEPNYSYVEDRYYRCDDEGVWYLGRYQVGEWFSGPYEGVVTWYSEHFVEPGLIAPASVSVGDSWTYSAEYTWDSSSGSGSIPLTSEYSYTVMDDGTWTVPAGSFDAVRVNVSGTLQYYYAPDVGLLESPTMELTAWE